MKKLVSLLLALVLIMAAPLALAADDPFYPGVNYNTKYKEFGAVPSMLNFGSARLAPGESLFDAKTTTITNTTTRAIENTLDSLTYYIYAKWQYAKSFDYHYVDAMLVMTDPTGNYYALYDYAELTDSGRNYVWRWFFDVNNLFERCMDDHGGSLPKGAYTFSMFFNDQSFRVNRVTLR